MHPLGHAVHVAAHVDVRPALQPGPQLGRPARASGPARRPCRAGRGRTRRRAWSARPSARMRIELVARSRGRWPGAARRRTASCARRRPARRRSSRKPTNGATPVPGPTMIVGVRRVGRRPEVRGALDEHRHDRLARASARNVEHTPLRRLPATSKRTVDTVSRSRWGCSNGLEAIEYWRGCSRGNTSTHACAGADAVLGSTRSTA